MADYTPTTEEVREWYTHRNGDGFYARRLRSRANEFDRWLSAHDAEVRASLLAEQGEPEWEYALMADGDDEPWSNYYESREHLVERCGGLAWREDEHLVRRIPAGPWLPVEENGENT